MQTFLESFKTPQEVYEYCKKKGVKGIQYSASKDVFSMLLKAEYPERFENGEQIEVLPHSGITRYKANTLVIENHATPPVIRLFLRKFDEGDYPDLIKESPNA